MNKKRILIPVVPTAAVILSVVLVSAVMWLMHYQPKAQPFKDLTVEEIEDVAIGEGKARYHLSTAEERAEFVRLLNAVVIYQKDNTWREYDGICNADAIVSKRDGTAFGIQFSMPFVLVQWQKDGDWQGYLCEEPPCEAAGTFIDDISFAHFGYLH